MSLDNSSQAIARMLMPDDEGQLRMGIFIDRAEGKAFAVILNRANHHWAALTISEHEIQGDTFEGILDAVNEVCADIQRWGSGDGRLTM